jgi:poly-gamma-glutamate capsule biosynthesis protein CapA/YwtB (metallophosphatase superfamily)
MLEQQISISCTGDISFNSKNPNLRGGIGSFLVSNEARSIWERSDIRTGNLEAPTTLSERKVWSKLTLRAPLNTCRILRKIGFDMLSVANNHMMDFGPEGLNECTSHVTNANIRFGGSGADVRSAVQPNILDHGKGTIAFFCWCDVVQDSPLYATSAAAGVAPFHVNEAVAQVKAIRASVDWVVCHIHWGEEFSQLPSPSQRTAARELADAGVDLIIGHHPHVLQGAEVINKTAVLYSLGNFLFFPQRWAGVNAAGERFYARYRLHPLSRQTGMATVTLSKTTAPTIRFTPALLNRSNLVVPDITEIRILQWNQLCRSLDAPDYANRFESELQLARQRKVWCGEWRTILGRVDLTLFRYGLKSGFRS